MNKKEVSLFKKEKFLAVVMIFAGVVVWFFSDSDKGLIQDLVKGVGIFLFLVGLINIRGLKDQRWSQLSDRQKQFKVVALVVLVLLVLLTLLFV
tara:strand:+ start:365 stop:646 length:282 start_codon:yes stop_codon:yes gene_type:complete